MDSPPAATASERNAAQSRLAGECVTVGGDCVTVGVGVATEPFVHAARIITKAAANAFNIGDLAVRTVVMSFAIPALSSFIQTRSTPLPDMFR
jgi:hypothetical protein